MKDKPGEGGGHFQFDIASRQLEWQQLSAALGVKQGHVVWVQVLAPGMLQVWLEKPAPPGRREAEEATGREADAAVAGGGGGGGG